MNGADAAAKIAILASIAFHTRVTLEDVPFEGIERAGGDRRRDSRAELGYRIKLIAAAERPAGGVAARVHPTLVPDGHPLAAVDGSFNAVMLRGPAIREITLAGPGAGGDETASAVIGDLMASSARPARASSRTTATFAGAARAPGRRPSRPSSCASTSTTRPACWPRSRASWPTRTFDRLRDPARDRRPRPARGPHPPRARGPLLRSRARHPGRSASWPATRTFCACCPAG